MKAAAAGETGIWQNNSLLFLLLLSLVLFGSINRATAQERAETKIRVEVNMVQLNVAVMDSKGNYVTGLRPSDFVVTEDGIPQKVATFGEGNEPREESPPTGPTGQVGRPSRPW